MKLEPINVYIGCTLKELRKAASMTQPQLAQALGVPYQSVQRMEAGKIHFRAPLLFTISKIFGVSVAYLFGLDEKHFGFGPTTCRVVALLAQMGEADRAAVERACLIIKHGEVK